MEKEIELLNEIIANAVIHGGDWGGTYDSNIESLVLAINNWLREKGVRDKYHVIERSYVHTLTYNLQNGETVIKEWKPKSRSASWTPEMKEQARQRAVKQRRTYDSKENKGVSTNTES